MSFKTELGTPQDTYKASTRSINTEVSFFLAICVTIYACNFFSNHGHFIHFADNMQSNISGKSQDS